MTDDAEALDREYGQRTKTLREERGLTQAEVVRRMQAAGVTHMNASTLSRIESGARALRLSEADALSRIYDVRLAMLTLREPTFEQASRTVRTLDEAAKKTVQFRELARELAEAQVMMPGIARGLDAVYERATDADLIKQLDALKRRMDKFARADFAAEVVEIRNQALGENDRAWRRARSNQVSGDGEHQAEA